MMRNATTTLCTGFVALLLLISAVLIGVSLKKLTSTEYGLAYDVHLKKLDDAAKAGGLHSGPPGFEFVKFPSTYITVELPPDGGESLTCVSQDGLRVQFAVTFQYQMPAEWLPAAVMKYKDFGEWESVVYAAGNSAVQHSCSLFTISNFQNKRGIIQSTMEDILREKLEGTDEVNHNGVYARAISLQLRNVDLPEEYRSAVQAKQSSSEDITLARNQRHQETTKAKTQLLSAMEEARKINQTAVNNANIAVTEAELRAQEIMYAFETEATIVAKVRADLNLTTEGVLAYLANRLVEKAPQVVIKGAEPAPFSLKDEL